MNTGSVIKGGLLAGLIINIGEVILNGWLIADGWQDVMANIGMAETSASYAYYIILGFVIGLVGLWLYAAARPRLGAGPGTAIKMGLLLWLLGWVFAVLPWALGGIIPWGLTAIALVWALVEVPLAIAVGAWLYTEGDGDAAMA